MANVSNDNYHFVPTAEMGFTNNVTFDKDTALLNVTALASNENEVHAFLLLLPLTSINKDFKLLFWYFNLSQICLLG